MARPQHSTPDREAKQQLSFSHRNGLYDSQNRIILKNLNLREMGEWCLSVGESELRARQLYKWLMASGTGQDRWVRSLDEADGEPQSFSAPFKALISATANLSGGLTLESVHSARDGTRKLVFALNPGEGSASGTVETVLIPMTDKTGGNLRYTACVSSQVGCAMNCQFCLTGRMGLLGNLNTAQIVEQVIEARRYLKEQGSSTPIHNIVFMGMGEPFHNYDAVQSAVEVMTEPKGLGLSRHKVLVSTVGLVPEIKRFVAAGRAKLAVSLHATTDEVRNWIVPLNRKYPLAELLGTLREAFPTGKLKGDNFVIFEYVLLSDVNDTVADAERLRDLTADIYCCINLIVFNPHDGTAFRRSTDAAVKAFRGVLVTAGRICTLRTSKGDDEMAACGQLGNVNLASRPAPILQVPESILQRLMVATPASDVVAAATAAAVGAAAPALL
ncbi:MAG: hypothetical protein WDW36_009321 [Sanguina aurantia]